MVSYFPDTFIRTYPRNSSRRGAKDAKLFLVGNEQIAKQDTILTLLFAACSLLFGYCFVHTEFHSTGAVVVYVPAPPAVYAVCKLLPLGNELEIMAVSAL